MKRLYVGCRVRILWSRGWPELAGQEGRIVSEAETSGLRGTSEWEVAPDAWGTSEAPTPSTAGGSIFAPGSSQLEPIADPGHQVVSWEAMKDLWQPEGIPA